MKLRASILVPSLVVSSSLLLGTLTRAPQNPKIQADRAIEAHMAIPADVQQILHRSCYDCHSNRTAWPWYSRIPGVSRVVQDDVRRARHHLNLSDWSAKLAEGQDEAQASLNGICEELQSNTMPLAEYRWMHPKSRLSPAEVELVCHWTSTAKAR